MAGAIAFSFFIAWGYLIHKCDTDFLGASIVEIDLAETEENRRWWPHFRDRRVDLYGDILKIWCDK